MMNILAAVHLASYFTFAVIMSEINLTYHKSISARIFLMKVLLKPLVNWLSLKEIISGFRLKFQPSEAPKCYLQGTCTAENLATV